MDTVKIALQNVSKNFGGFKALDSVSFEVHDGECFFLLGPSGCGKTTVLRIIAGFCPCDSGRVLFDGNEVTSLAPHLRNAGMVFQNYALWPHLTVAENIEFGLTVPARRAPKNERAERIRQMIALLHLEGTEERYPGQLSGGQQQRVALARALVVKPACLLLDEPLSNLDAKLRMEMRLEIKHIIKTLGITAVYVTHDQTEALSMAGRCAIMRKGMIEQIGTPLELYERPANRFIADFLGYSNLLDASVISQDPGFLRLATTAGHWLSRSYQRPFPEGTKVAIAIRPEKVRVNAGNSNTPNTFSGRLKEMIYMGSATECRIELDCGLIINSLLFGAYPSCPMPAPDDKCLGGADRQSPKPQGCLAKEGERVWIMVEPGDVVVLPV